MEDLMDEPLTSNQAKAVKAWCNWYSAKLDRIGDTVDNGKDITEGYSGAEQDVFEAFGCKTYADE
jgi:hypothetical protein